MFRLGFKLVATELNGGRHKCDQIERFIGLWASFKACGNN